MSLSKEVLFVLPGVLGPRNILSSGVVADLVQKGKINISIATAENAIQEYSDANRSQNILWREFSNPVTDSETGLFVTLWYWLRYATYRFVHILLCERASYAALAYRFNDFNMFSGHRLRKGFSKAKRKSYSKVASYVDRSLGFPFSGSKFVFRILEAIYYWNFGAHPNIQKFFGKYRFDLVFVNFIQIQWSFSYVQLAKKNGAYMIGMVGSWDNLTARGPVFRGFDLYLVQSKFMARILAKNHLIPEEKIKITGWAQMDIYFNERTKILQNSVSKKIKNEKILCFGLNTPLHGRHEPSIVKFIKEKIVGLNSDLKLIVRPHPHDNNWHERFGFLEGDGVLFDHTNPFDTLALGEFVAASDIVISSAGSISLDAIAWDKPSINICFDGDLEVEAEDSIRNAYSFDHYASIVNSGGTWLVKSFQELEVAIFKYLEQPSIHSEGRRAIREEHLEPFDGNAAKRISNLIFTAVQNSPT